MNVNAFYQILATFASHLRIIHDLEVDKLHEAKTKNKTELTGFFEKMTEIHVTIKNEAKK